MTATITDKFNNTSSGVRPVSTTVSTIRNTGATTLACADLTGWPTDTPVHFVTYKIDGSGKVVVGSQTDWKGIVSGSNINSLTVTGATDAGNAAGDIVEMLPTARWGKELTDGIRVEHNQDGTHASITATNATVSGLTTTNNLTATGTVTLPAASVKASNIDFTTLAFGNYSTTETNTGFTWVNGKPIYKKTYTWATTGSGSEQGYTNADFASFTYVLTFQAMFNYTGEYWKDEYVNPGAPTGQNLQIKMGTTASTFQVRYNCGATGTIYFTVWYTK